MALLLLLSPAQATAEESYVMDGKPVSRAFYNSNLLVNDSIQLLRANRNQEASEKLKQAVALAPDYPEAHYNYGLALAKIGHVPEAIEQMQAAVTLNPALESSWITLAALFQASGHVDEAIKTYQQYLARFPGSAEAAKIGSLLQGLQQIAVTQTSNPAGQSDYLKDVTRDGIVRWPLSKMPLKVYLQPGQQIQGFRPSFEETLKRSFADWSAASGGIINFLPVASASDADIICSWTADSNKLANAAESGEAHVTTLGNQIVSVKLELLTISALPGTQITDNMIRRSSLHEIGHALGLTGHTTNPGDIMFYDLGTINDEWRNLSARDAATIVQLYSTK
jgi:predicted Zn-dependent protease/Flp pilus assembly protein TadD